MESHQTGLNFSSINVTSAGKSAFLVKNTKLIKLSTKANRASSAKSATPSLRQRTMLEIISQVLIPTTTKCSIARLVQKALRTVIS